MSATSSRPTKPTKTLISFDLAAVLEPKEIERFKQAADAAGAKSLTEHFINITLRAPQQKAA